MRAVFYRGKQISVLSEKPGDLLGIMPSSMHDLKRNDAVRHLSQHAYHLMIFGYSGITRDAAFWHRRHALIRIHRDIGSEPSLKASAEYKISCVRDYFD